ncbi:MAG: DUF4038 domain-containing protein [Thermoanaerobaculia bacterium]
MRKTISLALLTGVLGIFVGSARAEAAGATCKAPVATAYSWNRWECVLEVEGDFSGRRGYAETQLRVTFTAQGQPTRTTYAFWDKGAGTATNKAQFIFRMAFPLTPEPFRWQWATTCETPATCGSTLPSLVTSGFVDVYKYGETGSPLYEKGLLKRVDYSWPRTNPTRFWSALQFASYSDFVWIGDSAWAAPMRATAEEWSQYLDNRRATIPGGSAVSIVQIGPAPPWTGALDRSGKPPFDTMSPCTVVPANESVVPTNCSIPNSDFWTAFDNKIKLANDKGIYVFLAGLMEPRSAHPLQTTSADYPTVLQAKTFARYLASRLSGSLVILSPGFDSALITKVSPTLVNEKLQVEVGKEIKRITPHLLVTNHWGTLVGSEAGQPAAVHADAWLDFQMFQSGNREKSSNQLAEVTQRARQLAWDMSGTSTPQVAPFSTNRKPAVNGEAIYEQNNVPNGNFNIYRARQTGYLSWLSGALGYTFGFGGVWDWGLCGTCVDSIEPPLPYACPVNEHPSPPNACGWQLPSGWRDFNSAMTKPSNNQMKYMGALISAYQTRGNSFLDTYEQGSGVQSRLISPSATDTAEEKKVALARGDGWWIAYLPHNDKVKLKTNGLTPNPALAKLFDPKTGTIESVAETGNSHYRCGSSGSVSWCEWDNKRYRSLDAANSDRILLVPVCSGSCVPAGQPSLFVFPGRLDAEKEWGILGELLDGNGVPDRAILQLKTDTSGTASRPAAVRGSLGHFLVVWQADANSDGWQEIWGQLASPKGSPTGEAILLSPQDERDHVNPSVAANSNGDFFVVWSAGGPFHDSSDILAQAVSFSGLLVGGTLTLVSEPGFESFNPKAAPNGPSSFSVAWVQDDRAGPDPTIRIQRFSLFGVPLDAAQPVNLTPAPVYWLEGLSIDANGNTAVRWEARDVAASLGRYQQLLTPAGELVDDESQIAPPSEDQ